MTSGQYTPALFHACGAFGLVPLLVGINGLLRPRSALRTLRIDPPEGAEARRLVDNLMVLYGSRDVFIGVATILSWHYRHSGMLGCMLVASGGVGFVDGAVNQAQCGKYGWSHWVFVPWMVAAGAALIWSHHS